MRRFNTAGPIKVDKHYHVDPLKRWDMSVIMDLIDNEKYFLLHAPRQTGKTSCLLALRDQLNKESKYCAIYTNFESATAFRENVEKVNEVIVGVLLDDIEDLKIESFDIKAARQYAKELDLKNALRFILRYLSINIGKPVVVFIDEIDSMVGDSLLNIFNQIRSGYTTRPQSFPHSIIVCGLRDVSDYRVDSSNPLRLSSGSPFNIITESLRLGNFSKDEVKALYTQYTQATGQKLADGCIDLVMEYTNGQPWLVNELANEIIFKMKMGEDTSIELTTDMFARAKERVVLARKTHLNQLIYRLGEERVQRVIAPMLNGIEFTPNMADVQYCIDLGLIKKNGDGMGFSNAIYKEIIPRELSTMTQDFVFGKYKPVWIKPNGYIDIKIILSQFRDFWNKNSTIWGTEIAGYREAAPQLILQAFLQKVVNGGGAVIREFALGSYRSDFLIEWRVGSVIQNIVLELKIIRENDKYETIRDKAIESTIKYPKTCGIDYADILIFDRDSHFGWDNDEQNEIIVYDNIKFEVWKLGSGILSKL